MWKALIAATAAGVIGGSSLLFAQQTPARGQEYDHDWESSAEDHDWDPSAEGNRDHDWRPSAEYDREGGRHLQKI